MKGWLAAFGIFIVVIMVVSGIASAIGGSSSANSSPNQAAMVNVCRNYVSNALTSPTSADFENLYDEINKLVNLGNNEYSLQSYVDADNSFGAKIRTHFFCKIKYTGGDGSADSNYIVTDLKAE